MYLNVFQAGENFQIFYHITHTQIGPIGKCKGQTLMFACLIAQQIVLRVTESTTPLPDEYER